MPTSTWFDILMNYHRRGYTINCNYLTDKIPRITCKPNIYCKAENDKHENVMLNGHEHIGKHFYVRNTFSMFQ